MNEMQRGIIILLKSAVSGAGEPLPKAFSLEQALPLIKKHNILTLAYEGALLCGISGQDTLMRQMLAAYCKATLVSEGQLREIGKLCEAFDREGIDYMPLKGCRMKHLYPRPELRPMGDADILIRLEQYDRIKPLMETLGFQEGPDTDHELVWKSRNLYLELHKRLIPSYNKDFYAYYGDGWRLAGYCEGTRYFMSPEDEWIYLFTHFAKHYRDGGIGLRHVLDLWVFRRKHPDMEEGYIAGVLKTLQLDVFHSNILRLFQAWFEGGQQDEILEIITAFVFESGSFGRDEMRVLSRAVRDRKHSALGFSGRLLYLWQTAFPSLEALREKYTVLKRFPWLLPAVWALRPVYKLTCERKSLSRKAKHMEALSEDNLKLRQKLLNAVGLNYNF